MREEYFTLYSDSEIEVLINKHETQDHTAIYFNDKSTLFQNSLSYLLCHPLKKISFQFLLELLAERS